jgi:hypothetical protein
MDSRLQRCLAESVLTCGTRVGRPARLHQIHRLECTPGTHQVGELVQDSARKVREQRIEVEPHIPRRWYHDESLTLPDAPRLCHLRLGRVESIHLGRECCRQVLERVVEAGKRERQRLVLRVVLGAVEDADDAMYAAVDLELGEEGERVRRGVGRGSEVVEEERAWRRWARGEDSCGLWDR